MLNFKIVFNVLGVLLVTLSVFMLLTLPFALYYEEEDVSSVLLSSAVTFICGMAIWMATKNARKEVRKKEGFLIVALGWIAVSIFSALPYLFDGTFPESTSAFFESASGLTTTGATALSDIQSVPRAILFWRSLTQWLGGMGIIVLTVAMFPLLGIGGVELFVAEAPGPTSDKIHPRIKETAKRLWFIYVGLSMLLMFLLWLEGMTFFDACNHALTTMATGGFSTKNASIAFYTNPLIHYTIILFMLVAGTNYTIIYYSIKGNFKKVWNSDEFKTYIGIVAFVIFILTAIVFFITNQGLELTFRKVSFQVISLVTTTGYITADYTAWLPAVTLVFFGLLFMGGCAGSTSGGIKVIRHLVFFKNSILELKRLLHPKAIIRTKIDRQVVPPRVLTHILVFLLIYLMLFVVGSLVMAFVFADWDHPLLTSVGAVATCLGNVGPAIGDLGPLDNFSEVPIVGKWLMILLMIMGRLELFTIILLFTPYFWRKV